MRYLLIYENEHWLQEELTEKDIENSANDVVEIYDLRDLTFHVTGDVWQKIKER